MSTATVRAAIASFVTNAGVTGVHKVFSAPPYWADGSDWDLALGLGSGSVVALHLPDEAERRATLPAIGGQKRVDYTAGLMIFYQYLLPSGSLTATNADAWAGPLDTITDGLKAAIRAAPTLNDGTVIFQAGQGRIHDGQPDLTVKRGIPRRAPGKVLSWVVLEFNVTEIVTA